MKIKRYKKVLNLSRKFRNHFHKTFDSCDADRAVTRLFTRQSRVSYVGVSGHGAFKLDHLQSVELILF